MSKYLQFWFFLFFTIFTLSKAKISLDDYCKYDSWNTPCYTSCERSYQCGQTNDEFQVFTDEERTHALKIHNDERQKAAAGEFASKHLPACTGGINALSYDKELEFLCNCHLKSCPTGHDYSRLTLKGERTGQNLFWKLFQDPQPRNLSLLDAAMLGWMNEIVRMTSPAPVNSFDGHYGVGHLSAVLWGDTKYVGCGMMHYYRESKHFYAVGCNYKPAGNVVGAKMYENKKCESAASTDALCGISRPLEADVFEPPIDLNRVDRLDKWSMTVYLLVTMLWAVIH